MVSPHQHYIDWRFVCGKMTQSEKAVIDQRERNGAGASGEPGCSFPIPSRMAHLLTTSRWLAVVLLAAAMHPPGAAPPGAVLLCPVYTSRRQRRLVHRTQLRRCTGGLGGHWPPTSRLGYIPRHCLLLLCPSQSNPKTCFLASHEKSRKRDPKQISTFSNYLPSTSCRLPDNE